jgi:hypothetical protein
MIKTIVTAAVLAAMTVLSFAAPSTNVAVEITGSWRGTTNNVDAESWRSLAYNDSGWAIVGNALFYIETNALPVATNTPLPANTNGNPMPCYYFRTTFFVTNINHVIAIIVTNLVDDGVVFYLNGTEIQRVRMNAGTVTYTTSANAAPPGGDATTFQTLTITGSTLTNLVNGTNILAARVHQQGLASDDVVFGAVLALVTDTNPAVVLRRGPYLQLCTPRSITIRWRTDLPRESTVIYGINLANMVNTNTVPGLVTDHEVLVTNLVADTVYYYAIGEPGKILAGSDTNHYFRTHPLPGSNKPLHIWVLGDSGTVTASQQAVRNSFYQVNGTNHVDACLMLGDNAYPNGTDAEYQTAVFNMYSTMLRRTVLWSTIGNHETYSTDPNGQYPYLNIFTMTTNAAAGGVPSNTELYYSFDIGPAHFICLDSMVSNRGSNATMATWLKLDLAATTNRWIIAFWHHPPYTKGSHDSDNSSGSDFELVQMRQNILPILEAGGVDLVLAGHSHCYERSKLIKGHYGFSATFNSTMVVDGGGGRQTNGVGGYLKPEALFGTPIGNRGTVYAVAGSSGQISGGSLNHPAMFVSLNLLGSMILDIKTNRLDAVFLREIVSPSPVTNDTFTIIKTNFPPTASNLVFAVEANTSTSLQLAGNDPNRNAFTFVSGSPATNGLLSNFNPATGSITYRPAYGSTNLDTFTFRTTDGQLTGTPGVVTVNILPPVDNNSNQLPDSWEAFYGVSDPNGDADGDGANNLNEYWSGTNPINTWSWLRIIQINKGESGYQIVWSSVGGVRYRVLFSDGDAPGSFNGIFTPVIRPVTEEMDPNPIGSPGTLSFLDDFTLTGGPPAQGARYYRLQVVN